MADDERKEVTYSGRVQGVGFRYTARHIAADFQVSGYVENLPDGRVHLVAEGALDELKGFLERLQTEMGHYIKQVTVEDGPASGEFSSFRIRQ